MLFRCQQFIVLYAAGKIVHRDKNQNEGELERLGKFKSEIWNVKSEMKNAKYEGITLFTFRI